MQHLLFFSYAPFSVFTCRLPEKAGNKAEEMSLTWHRLRYFTEIRRILTDNGVKIDEFGTLEDFFTERRLFSEY